MEGAEFLPGPPVKPQAGPREITGAVFLRWEGYTTEVRMISTHRVQE